MMLNCQPLLLDNLGIGIHGIVFKFEYKAKKRRGIFCLEGVANVIKLKILHFGFKEQC